MSIRCGFCVWLREHIVRPMCGDILFNSDMSLEIDQLLADNERLRDLIESVEAVRK